MLDIILKNRRVFKPGTFRIRDRHLNHWSVAQRSPRVFSSNPMIPET